MKEYIRFGLVLLIISSISAGILRTANNMTLPIIEEREIKAQIEARKSVFTEADEFDDKAIVKKSEIDFIPAYKEKKHIGYVVNAIGQGYGGDINFTFAFDLDGKIKGVKILSAKETPGLGDKIFGEDWLKLWIDRDKNYEFQVGKDSFAGATISPRAVYTKMIDVLEIYENEVKK